MKEVIKEWFQILLFFLVMCLFLVFLIWINEEKPHRIRIDGKNYTKMKEWNGDHFQIILLPVDSSSSTTK